METQMILWKRGDEGIQMLKYNADTEKPRNLDEWMQKINSLDVFCLLPGNTILSGKMLLDLLKWPPVLGASDRSIMELVCALQTPEQYFTEEVYQTMMEEVWLKKAGTNVTITMDCQLYYNLGGITRACLAALQGSLSMDLQATKQNKLQRRMKKEEGGWGITGYSSFHHVTYEEWILMLWANVPDICKETQDNKDASSSATSSPLLYKSFEDFERFVRHLVMPIDKYSISHLVLQTAWEGENIMCEDKTW